MTAVARTAIIDIGSNSIRLVVYDGPERAPATLFNEKVMAGLGRGLGETGRLDPEAASTALRALARFAELARAMQVAELRTVATAAVRDAANRDWFLAEARALGLSIELLSGEEEASAAALGVISAFPGADGVVGDLGGGSLELARVRNGQVHQRASFPLGVLRLGAFREKGAHALERQVRNLLDKSGWLEIGAGLPFYLVGGSWRSLARLHMHLTDYPLPVLHNYAMAPEVAARLVRVLARMDKKRLREVPSLSAARVPALADSAALLSILARQLTPSALVVSAYGLREGLLFERLTAGQRGEDPLIAMTRAEGERQGRFDEHGDVLDRWIAPLFEGEAEGERRLRLAACLLGDVAWLANPEFRSQRGLESALHGNWVGIDGRGRAMIGQALFTSFGGSGIPEAVTRLLSDEDAAHATRWGLAMRLGQRLSGGVAAPLADSRIALSDERLTLTLDESDAALYGDVVERRLRQLAIAFDRKPELEISETPARGAGFRARRLSRA